MSLFTVLQTLFKKLNIISSKMCFVTPTVWFEFHLTKESIVNVLWEHARSSKLFKHLCLSDVLKEGVINNIPTTIKLCQKYNLFRMKRKSRCLNGSLFNLFRSLALCSDIVLRYHKCIKLNKTDSNVNVACQCWTNAAATFLQYELSKMADRLQS